MNTATSLKQLPDLLSNLSKKSLEENIETFIDCFKGIIENQNEIFDRLDAIEKYIFSSELETEIKTIPLSTIVLNVMIPDEDMSSFEIFKLVVKQAPNTNENKVSHALSHLNSSGKITKLLKGRYRLDASTKEQEA